MEAHAQRETENLPQRRSKEQIYSPPQELK
jgi:hypothetical protein